MIDLRFFREMLEHKLLGDGLKSAADTEALLTLAVSMIEDTEYYASNCSLRHGGHCGPEVFEAFKDEWEGKMLEVLVSVMGYEKVKNKLEGYNSEAIVKNYLGEELGDLDAHPF